MKMKLYLASAIMALSWMGCSQEEVVNETKGNVHTICAVIEGTSRSTVTDAGKFSWASGDQISVHDASNKDIYTYSGTGNDFTFQGTTTVSVPVVAYYPANDSHTISSFYLPNSYGDENTEYVADTHAAMIATPPTNGDTYAFMHLGGVMRFNVKNVPVGANKFTFYSLNKRITGNFDVTESNGVRTIKTDDNDAQENGVSIIFKPLEAEQDMTFYVPLPLGSYEKYKIEIAGNGDSGTFSYENTTNNLSDGANTINRKSLLLMPTFTFALDANETNQLVKGESAVNVIKLQDSSETTISDDAEVIVTPGDADAIATLNYIPKNDGTSTLAISDGSAYTESGESEGKVVVNTTQNSTIASCEIDAPSLTVELSAENNADVTYTEVTALTAQQTLIIGSGVTVQTLKLKGGNVIIEEGATVETIINADGFTGKTYIVEEGGLTNSPSVNNIIVVSNESEMALRIAAENGGTVVLEEDVTLVESLTIAAGKDVTLDLNGKTISQEKAQTTGYQMILNDGNLTIKDSQTGGKISYADTGNGGEYISNTITNRGTLTVESGTIENVSPEAMANVGYAYAIDTSIWGAANEVVVNIKGGTISSIYSPLRVRADSDSEKVEANISGGILNGRIDHQMSSSKAGVLGSLNISAGTFNAYGIKTDVLMIFGAGENTDASGITANITGGTFNAGILVYKGDYVPIGVNFNEKFISGGTFKKDPSAYLAEGKQAVENNGVWTISDIE